LGVVPRQLDGSPDGGVVGSEAASEGAQRSIVLALAASSQAPNPALWLAPVA
jgi:hypothetical protein